MTKRAMIRNLEDHPNVDEILGVLAQLAEISDDDLRRLAQVWRNPVAVAEARHRALSPDSPLILEVLSAFDAIAALYADDLAGRADYVSVDPAITSTALKAVRDGVAAAYARPILSRQEHSALIGPWRAVFPKPMRFEPDFGPAGEDVRSLISAYTVLANRCHDQQGRRLYDGMVAQAMTIDEEEHADALASAWDAAVRSGRRRIWTLVRRTAAQGYAAQCSSCHRSQREEDERVLELCLDAACAMLVSDSLGGAQAQLLLAPVMQLIPQQRGAS